jgi:hypothetical protein
MKTHHATVKSWSIYISVWLGTRRQERKYLGAWWWFSELLLQGRLQVGFEFPQLSLLSLEILKNKRFFSGN